MQNILKILGSNIRRLRKDLGWTQERLAEEADISVPFMTQIELGRKPASLAVVAQIAEALGVEYSVLFSSDATSQKENKTVSYILKIFEKNIIADVKKTIADDMKKLEEKIKNVE